MDFGLKYVQNQISAVYRGAKVLVWVGIVVIAAVAIYYWWRKRQQTAQGDTQDNSLPFTRRAV
jgi:LPXTG-motif cell wall-anchored protein